MSCRLLDALLKKIQFLLLHCHCTQPWYHLRIIPIANDYFDMVLPTIWHMTTTTTNIIVNPTTSTTTIIIIIIEKNGSKFSHLLTIRADGADRKISVFYDFT